ncbi:MAG: YdeI/OmpD-associated family protein [Opitutaceae bacterium]|nr:YdeI/OmpD-associated family protein [Opitutaceae bacterium]
MKDDQLVFENRAAFKKWLAKNHQNSPGIWLVFGKDGKLKTLTANEALEEALCFGWIDGQFQSLGAEKYLKRFTPRRKGSVWSERNRKLAQKLIEEGAMTAAGQAAIAQAQEGGTWDRPKPAPISEVQVGILTEALSGAGKALTNFLNMSPSVRRTYTGFYLEAKKEDTRKKRLERIIERLKQNKKPM